MTTDQQQAVTEFHLRARIEFLEAEVHTLRTTLTIVRGALTKCAGVIDTRHDLVEGDEEAVRNG